MGIFEEKSSNILQVNVSVTFRDLVLNVKMAEIYFLNYCYTAILEPNFLYPYIISYIFE